MVSIQFHYHISGGFIKGKSIDQIYNVVWDNSSTTKVFSIFRKDFPGWVIFEEITVNIMLRTDIIYDLDISAVMGRVRLEVPENVIINSLTAECSTGAVDIEANSNVIFQASVTIGTSTGSVNFSAIDTIFNSFIRTRSSTGGCVCEY
ncbi:MAG: hypothetical protein ACTSWY_14810 [Promethearchaeota archaeon]